MLQNAERRCTIPAAREPKWRNGVNAADSKSALVTGLWVRGPTFGTDEEHFHSNARCRSARSADWPRRSRQFNDRDSVLPSSADRRRYDNRCSPRPHLRLGHLRAAATMDEPRDGRAGNPSVRASRRARALDDASIATRRERRTRRARRSRPLSFRRCRSNSRAGALRELDRPIPSFPKLRASSTRGRGRRGVRPGDGSRRPDPGESAGRSCVARWDRQVRADPAGC